jgi:transmembrane sensor
MTDLATEMSRLRNGGFSSVWGDTRQKAVEKTLLKRLERAERARRIRFRAMGIAAVAAIVLGVCSTLGGTERLRAWMAASHSPSRGGTAATLVLADGSWIAPEPNADVRWSEVSPGRVTAVLKRGRAHFDVVHADERVFRVEAGAVVVQVLGTAFDVEDREDGRTGVSVARGQVRVLCGDATSDLAAGESAVFPPDAAVPATGRPTPVAPAPAGRGPVAEAPSNDARTVLPTRSGWRELAQNGAFDEAYLALRHDVPRDSDWEVKDLLLASDVARLSHHPADAVEPLQRILSTHRDDPRASLAAFTLGRVYLESMGRPHEAALAFAEARALAPRSELAPDALAREVEARAQSGDTEGARALALEYVRVYPDGSRLHSVRRYGGLE